MALLKTMLQAAGTDSPGRSIETRYRPEMEALETRCLLSGDMVLHWNGIALDAVKQDFTFGAPEQGGPTRTSRALAIVHAAIFDAVNSIDESYTPYVVDLRAPAGASIEAAAAQAAHDTLAALYPSQKATFDAELEDSLDGIMRGAAAGARVGSRVAEILLGERADDGSQAPEHYDFSPLPGRWQPDPLHPDQDALTPQWGQVQPFAINDVSAFRAAAPPSLKSRAYWKAFEEAKALGGDGVTTPTIRTPEQTEIGIFWGYDGSPGLGVPPRLYNQIAVHVAEQMGNSMVENSRMLALVNLAMADAGIAAWETKYVYNLWRPVTAIREADHDGNPRTQADVTWTPLGAPQNNGGGDNFTPPFPAYTSGHATFGAALFRTLAHFYGRDDVQFTIGSDEYNGMTRDQNDVLRPVVYRTFDSFSQAAEENGQSRIYLGIHWSFDKTEGIQQGNRIADYIYKHELQPARHRAPWMRGFIGHGNGAAHAWQHSHCSEQRWHRIELTASGWSAIGKDKWSGSKDQMHGSARRREDHGSTESHTMASHAHRGRVKLHSSWDQNGSNYWF